MKITYSKLGHIFVPSGEYPWSKTHAQVPFPMDFGDRIRIYFSTRDDKGRSGVSFVEVDKNDPRKILYVHDKPCLQHGPEGTFDDSGTMPSWFLRDGDRILLYYTGWNKSDSAAYRLSVGLAQSVDNGLTFQRCFNGPILDRGPYDPIWVGQPCVLKEGEVWKMWYLSCQKVEVIHGRPEPFYNVKYAESTDGINWTRTEKISIDFDDHTDAIGRPFVWKAGNRYLMLHSNRRADGYRELESAGYRLEVSESTDGIQWNRVDAHFGKSKEGWDAVMNEYASYFSLNSHQGWLFYNGMGFGGSGFGHALMKLEE